MGNYYPGLAQVYTAAMMVFYLQNDKYPGIPTVEMKNFREDILNPSQNTDVKVPEMDDSDKRWFGVKICDGPSRPERQPR